VESALIQLQGTVCQGHATGGHLIGASLPSLPIGRDHERIVGVHRLSLNNFNKHLMPKASNVCTSG
jgi:hypothetical protein